MSRKHSITPQMKAGGRWIKHSLLAAWLLILGACSVTPGPTVIPIPTQTATSTLVPIVAPTPSPTVVPTPTPDMVVPCGIDVMAYVFAAGFSLEAGNLHLGRLVESAEAYIAAFGINPETPYNPEQPETAINWYVQNELAAVGVQLARNGRAVILPGFAQRVGLEQAILNDELDAQVFFAGVDEGQVPDNALRAVMHASPYGGYVINMADGAGNLYLFVEEGSGATLGFPDQVGVEMHTDVVQLDGPGEGHTVPVKVDGCDWILAEVDGDRVETVLTVEPRAALAWQMNPNPPEAVVAVPTPETTGEREVGMACQTVRDDRNCDHLTPEMLRPLEEAEVRHLFTVDGSGQAVPMADGRHPELDRQGSDYEMRAVACTLRGWVPFPYYGTGSNGGEVVCEVRMGEISQYLFYLVSDQPGNKSFFYWEGPAFDPASMDPNSLRRENVPYADQINWFQDPRMAGRQVIFYFHVENEGLVTHPEINERNLTVLAAIENGSPVDIEGYTDINIMAVPQEAFELLP